MEENAEQQEKLPWEGLDRWERKNILTPEQKEMFRQYQYEKYKDRKGGVYYEDIMPLVVDPDNPNDDYDELNELYYSADMFTRALEGYWYCQHPILGFFEDIWCWLKKRFISLTGKHDG